MPHVTLAGHRLYCEWRAGPDPARETVLFLHDGLGATGAWKQVPEAIAGPLGLNALVYDRWGYGRSDPRESFPYGFMEAEVPVLAGLLDHFGLERAHLVGHSDGGSIALLLAARQPERVISLVTEAAHTFVEPETQAGIRDLLALQAAGKTPPWLGRLHGERAEALLAAWGEGWLTDAHARWNIQDGLERIACPTLVIQGEADEFGTPAQVRSISERVAGAETWLIPDCGHTPHVQAADAFVARVSGFLGRQVGRAQAAGAVG